MSRQITPRLTPYPLIRGWVWRLQHEDGAAYRISRRWRGGWMVFHGLNGSFLATKPTRDAAFQYAERHYAHERKRPMVAS